MRDDISGLRALLEALYSRYNRLDADLRDPIVFLHRCSGRARKEVVGVIAAMLAYGRIEQIMVSVGQVIGRLGPDPLALLLSARPDELRRRCSGFAHRFADGEALFGLLCGLASVLRRHGSLQACFLAHTRPADTTVLGGLAGLAHEIMDGGGLTDHLVADPHKGSACKRWHLFLRWMVRRDEIDCGVWPGISPSQLIVPLDAHMWRVCRRLGLTRRRTCGLAAALEITRAFRAICPQDPVRYDFALMHASAAGDPDLSRFVCSQA